ncbi:MAG: rhamnulokinase [Chthoniobacterales bacterium]|nr:rhamnulokinase [Chthoniobacterales bacterium]
MNAKRYIACDLGAESGRVMLGTLAGGKLYLEEIHRFANLPVRMGNSIRWDILGMFRELKNGLAMVARREVEVEGISVDSWGVDYVWVGAGQPMLSPPFIYRDARIDRAFEEALRKVEADRIYELTGIQFMPFNTCFQLFADHRDSPALVGIADCFLPIADFFNYLFSGVRRTERSLASTTQLFNPWRREWSEELIREFGFRREVFPEIVPSGTRLGAVLPEVREETGLKEGASVFASCSHDTGSAVAAVPADTGTDWAYLSSGTWSLIGVELNEPLINRDVRLENFTNEAGYGGTVRFLKNLVGLWILQECRRAWEQQGRSFTYDEITNLAAEAEPLQQLINPDDLRFLKPGGMPEKICAFCRETGQPEPGTPGQMARCILESLALAYRLNLDLIEQLTGRTIRILHIVGGGSKSALLNQFAANATGRRVLAGPAEATAAGNLLIQATAGGEIGSIEELRRTVRDSFPIASFEPEDTRRWEEAFVRFQNFRGK